jgi:type IV secretion system protein VirD4
VIVGGSGTGKTYSYFLPNAAFSREVSLVFTDPKSELWRYTSGLHTALRYAPCEPDASEGFNWIPLCREARLAELCARAVVESGNTQYTEQIWLDMETAFLSALFSHASRLPVPTPLSAYRLFTRQPQETLLQQLLASPSEASREQATIFQQTQEKLRGSVVPSVAAKLQFLRDDAVARFTSATLAAPEFGGLRRVPLALYWCLNEADIVRLRPLTSLFFTLLLEQLCAQEGREAVPVQMYLEEFANIGVIPHFETVISLARGRGLRLFLGIQSLSQLEARYGKPNAQTILTNCATKIALSGLDVETAHYFSRALGPQTVVLARRSLHRRFLGWLPASVQETTTEHARPLLTADEIRRLGTQEALVIAGNHRPMVLSKYFYRRPPVMAAAPALGEAQAVVADATDRTEAKPKRLKVRPPPPPVELVVARSGRPGKSQKKASVTNGRWRPRALRGGESAAPSADARPILPSPDSAVKARVVKRLEETG